MGFAIAAAAVASGVATVVIWTGATGFGPTPNTVAILLYLDTIFLLLLVVVIVRRFVTLWSERRKGRAGSGLHVRIVVLFSLVAVAPAILVAVFSAIFLNFGLQAWFSERVRTAIEASNAIAHAYLEENQKNIRADVFAIANDLNREASGLMRDPVLFRQRLTAQANLRSLSEALVIDSSGRVLARSPLSLTLEYDLLPANVLDQAAMGQIVVVSNEQDDQVRAAIKLNRFVDAYLLVARFIDPAVLQNINKTELAGAQYRRLEQSREGILITFVMIFVVVAIMLLLAAVWIGLNLATQLTQPISSLITAAERVRGGDLSARVKPTMLTDEIGILSRAFNRMTSQLESQRDGLILANRKMDERRRFTETVLSGVSAGVIGLDAGRLINLPNRSASDLLGMDMQKSIGMPLSEVVPEMAELIDQAVTHPERSWQSEIRLLRNDQTRTLIVRVVAERLNDDLLGFVVTFDDITALVQAERKAAWADVARRIAHEIKNPLTPIQLASERLRKKYLKEIRSDPETFSACTETIIRQVEDIGRMVDEFSAFARMPRPELKPENLSELVRNTVMLERNRYHNIDIELLLPETDMYLVCDGRQVAQALTNILKNAAEAVIARESVDGVRPPPGHIKVVLEQSKDKHGMIVASTVSIEDNGRGLPADDRDRLTEPYMTTRAKGTGLGLAIVKKIMEDHNGEVVLEDRDGGGARVTLHFGTPGLVETDIVDPRRAESSISTVSPSGETVRTNG
ncbi:MAG: PAS domain-containing sensor histidine kinase [Hyphomicrobiales bacterium]|nr:PAS domain-containing sensor histidine kinase [Hyphomicrobiales bacterium]